MKKKFIAKYEVLSSFASGPTGELFKAKDLGTNRLLLIKLFYKNSKIKKSDLEIFKQKSSLISTLKNKNIADIYSAGKLSDNRCYIAFELIEGESLSTLCNNIPTEELITYFYELAQILDELHQKGISHGNLKLSNIIINNKNKKLYLTDFNLFQDDTKVSSNSTTNDLFLFAVGLYTALMGKLPFGVKNLSEIINDTEQKLQFDEIDTKYTLVVGKIFKKAFSRTEDFPYKTLVNFVKDVAETCEIKLHIRTKDKGKPKPEVSKPEASVVQTPLSDNPAKIKPLKESVKKEINNPQRFDPYNTLLGENKKENTCVKRNLNKKVVPQNIPTISNFKIFVVFVIICLVAWFLLFNNNERDLELEPITTSNFNTGVLAINRAVTTNNNEINNSKVSGNNQQSSVSLGTLQVEPQKQAHPSLAKVKIPPNLSDENITELDDQQILYLLQAKNVEYRVLALALGEVSRRGNLSFYTPLQLLYNNKNSTIRGYVALALKHDNYLKQQNTLTILVNLLHDKDYIVRGQAAKTLGKLGTEVARKKLYDRLIIEKQQIVKNSINNALGIAIQ
ncbi:MAG: protein kinase [Deltaproteobacteria bacterium]|nr:protein kinase [Deltaproteobacteria bacterium]